MADPLRIEVLDDEYDEIEEPLFILIPEFASIVVELDDLISVLLPLAMFILLELLISRLEDSDSKFILPFDLMVASPPLAILKSDPLFMFNIPPDVKEPSPVEDTENEPLVLATKFLSAFNVKVPDDFIVVEPAEVTLNDVPDSMLISLPALSVVDVPDTVEIAPPAFIDIA